MKFFIWDGADQGENFEEKESIEDESLFSLATEYRQKLIEKIVELDDSLTEKYLEEKPIEVEELKAVLRKATLEGSGLPCLLWFGVSE